MPELKIVRNQKKFRSRRLAPLYMVSFMGLCWAIFDGVISYVSPIVITEHGLSLTTMGIIVGSSSVAGAVFDLVLCRILRNATYRKMFLLMFAVCLVYPAILWQAKTVGIYLVAMVLWGLYYDLKNFGNFDYVARESTSSEHTSSFGVLSVFQSLGYMLAPLLAGLVLGKIVDWKPFALSWIFLGLAFAFFVVLMVLKRKQASAVVAPDKPKKINLLLEAKLWERIGQRILPVLMLTLILNVIDAFFWTIGPLYAEEFGQLKQFEGLVLTMYMLPSLLVGWFVGSLTRRMGKKRTAFLFCAIGSAGLVALPFFTSAIFILITIFLASCCLSLSWPSVNGAYADYMSEAPLVGTEIEGIEDFFTNIGYVIGPIMAGFLADRTGTASAFAVLGVVVVVLSSVLMFIVPKHISVARLADDVHSADAH